MERRTGGHPVAAPKATGRPPRFQVVLKASRFNCTIAARVTPPSIAWSTTTRPGSLVIGDGPPVLAAGGRNRKHEGERVFLDRRRAWPGAKSPAA